jgi:hypothetical protein
VETFSASRIAGVCVTHVETLKPAVGQNAGPAH